MQIEKHIAALLYRYQCVIVPGFGAFLTETASASLNRQTGTLYPPKKHISFNANLKNNDGLLANHIALQEKISYDMAVSRIAGAVQGWKDTLQGGGSLVLKNLGELQQMYEGALVFTPDSQANYLTDAFGLGTVVSPAVKREVYRQQAEAIEEKAPVIFTPERKRSYSYLKYAAIFAVAATLGAAAFVNHHNNQLAAQALQVERDVQQDVRQRIEQASFFIDTLPAVTLPLKVGREEIRMPYHIVAGAYRGRQNAEAALNGLKEVGYTKAAVLPVNKYSLYPVVYGSYNSAAEAQHDLRLIQQKHNREAWLMVQE